MTRGAAFDVQAVCAGFVYAVSVADSLIKNGVASTALVIGAETFSRILDWNGSRDPCSVRRWRRRHRAQGGAVLPHERLELPKPAQNAQNAQNGAATPAQGAKPEAVARPATAPTPAIAPTSPPVPPAQLVLASAVWPVCSAPIGARRADAWAARRHRQERRGRPELSGRRHARYRPNGRQCRRWRGSLPFTSSRRIAWTGTKLVLRDLASTNGVYSWLSASRDMNAVRRNAGGAGGRAAHPEAEASSEVAVPLHDQDLILVGQQVLKFEVVPNSFDAGLGPAVEHSTLLFGSPAAPGYARLGQRTVEGITRDVYYVRKMETVLGRESGDMVFTEDPFLSRRHAAVRVLGRDGSSPRPERQAHPRKRRSVRARRSRVFEWHLSCVSVERSIWCRETTFASDSSCSELTSRPPASAPAMTA